MSEEKRVIGGILRKQLAWVGKLYKEDPMDCWVNGYRNALRTVLREANRKRR